MPVIEMATKEDWEYLGLEPGASVAEIKAAWKRLSTKTHPDAGGTDALFRRVREAYDRVLTSAEYRAAHGNGTDENAATRAKGSTASDRQSGAGPGWEPPKWKSTSDERPSGPGGTAAWGASEPAPASSKRSLAALALAPWRWLLLGGSWPTTSFGAGLSLLLAAVLTFLVNASMGPGLGRTVVDFVPGVLVVGRIIALPARLGG